MFLLGNRPDSPNTQIRKENDLYHDIVQEDFIDLQLLKEKQFLKSKSILCNSPRYVADDLIPVRDLKKKRNNK